MAIHNSCHLSVTCTHKIVSLSQSTDWGIHNQLWWWRTLPPQSGIASIHMFTRWVLSISRLYPPPLAWIQHAICEENLCEQLLTQIWTYRRDISFIIIYLHIMRAQCEIQGLNARTLVTPCLILCRQLCHQNLSRLLLLVGTWPQGYGAGHSLWICSPHCLNLVVQLGQDPTASGNPDSITVKPMAIHDSCHLSVTCTHKIVSLSQSTDWGIHNQLRWWHTLPPQSSIAAIHMFTRWVLSISRLYLPPLAWIQHAICEETLCKKLLTQIWTYHWDISLLLSMYISWGHSMKYRASMQEPQLFCVWSCADNYTTRAYPDHFYL